MHETEAFEEICETLMRELEKANEKLRRSGGEMSSGDLEYVDKLTHALKSVKTTMAMLEAGDYSYEGGGSYAEGGGMSNARGGGRGGNRGGGRSNRSGGYSQARRRDSRGRYSRAYSNEGYSYEGEEMIDELREIMQETDDPQMKEEFKRFIKRLEGL